MRGFFLALTFVFTAAQGYSVETLAPGMASVYRRAKQNFRHGSYNKAMDGFMEVIIKEPDFQPARHAMKDSALILMELEKKRVGGERQKLVSESAKIAKKIQNLRRLKARADARWKKLMSRALKRASKPKNLFEPLAAYYKALRALPLWSDSMDDFKTAKAEFQRALLKGFPEVKAHMRRLGKIKKDMNPGDMLSMILIREPMKYKEEQIEGLRPMNRLKNVNLATSIKVLENRDEAIIKSAGKAFSLYCHGRYGQSIPLWRNILAADSVNPEATFYLKQADFYASRRSASVRRSAGKKAATPAVSASKTRKVQSVKKRRYRKPVSRIEVIGKPASLPKKEAAPATVKDAYQKGLRAYALGDLDRAIRLWRKCLVLNPKYSRARRALSRALREKQ